MHFGAKNDGFMINLRFDLGEKSRGVVKPLFSPMPKGDITFMAPSWGLSRPRAPIAKIRIDFLSF